MPMEFSGSSYPKAEAQQSDPLSTISKLNTIQQQDQQIQKNAIGIDREKLQLFNEHSNTVKRAIGGLLAVPQGELTSQHFLDVYQNLANHKLMTSEQLAKEASSLPTLAGSKSPQDYEARLRKVAGTQLMQAETAEQMVNHFAGNPASLDTGNQIVLGNQGRTQVTGNGVEASPFTQTGNSYPKQIAPGTTGVDIKNNPAYQGTASGPPQSFGPPGSKPALPVAPTAGPTGATAQGGGALRPAPPANFTEGKEQYNKDVAIATDKLTQVKPAQQALKLMTPEVLTGLTGTGPIAATLSKGISAVNGVLGLKGDLADRVAAREEIVKKMHKYVSNSSVAGRSDAAQILAEASSPHPNVQSLKALVNLTRDAISSDRVEAARALAFENKGNNYQDYQSHRANFPNNIDTDAFKLDLMPPKERDELIEKMKKSDNKTERERFINSLRIAKKLNMFD